MPYGMNRNLWFISIAKKLANGRECQMSAVLLSRQLKKHTVLVLWFMRIHVWFAALMECLQIMMFQKSLSWIIFMLTVRNNSLFVVFSCVPMKSKNREIVSLNCIASQFASCILAGCLSNIRALDRSWWVMGLHILKHSSSKHVINYNNKPCVRPVWFI